MIERGNDTMHEQVRNILQASAVIYSERHHKDMPGTIQSPHDFASALGYEIGRIAKTLLMRAPRQDLFFLIVLSSNKRADIPELSRALNIKRAQVATKEELSEILGYPQTGVSPITSKALRVLIDNNLMRYPTVLIGSGEVGTEIEMRPQDLQSITNASVLGFTV